MFHAEEKDGNDYIITNGQMTLNAFKSSLMSSDGVTHFLEDLTPCGILEG